MKRYTPTAIKPLSVLLGVCVLLTITGIFLQGLFSNFVNITILCFSFGIVGGVVSLLFLLVSLHAYLLLGENTIVLHAGKRSISFDDVRYISVRSEPGWKCPPLLTAFSVVLSLVLQEDFSIQGHRAKTFYTFKLKNDQEFTVTFDHYGKKQESEIVDLLWKKIPFRNEGII